MDKTMYVYKIDIKLIIGYVALVNMLIFIILFVVNKNIQVILMLLGILNCAYPLILFSKKLPIKIIVDIENNKVRVEYMRFFQKDSIEYNKSDMRSTFRKEIITRGMIGEIFRLYIKEESILEILPDVNGWHKRDLNGINKLLSH